MALFCLYRDFEGIVLTIPYRLFGGQLIDSAQYPIAALVAAGAQLVAVQPGGTGVFLRGDGEWAAAGGFTPNDADPEIMTPPWFQLQDNTSNTGAAYGSTTSYANYFGRCMRSYTSFDVRLNVVMAMTGTTWGEFAIAKSIKPFPGTARNLTIVGFADVSAIINTTGNKTITIPVDGSQAVNQGDHVWLVFAKLSTGTPAFRSHPVADLMDMGFLLNGGNVRPSLILGTPTSFAAGQTSMLPIRFAVWPT